MRHQRTESVVWARPMGWLARTRSGCCARGHAAAAPPSSVMKSRRTHSITSSVRARQRDRHLQTKRLRCLTIDDQLELVRELHRQIGRPFAFQHAVDIPCRARASATQGEKNNRAMADSYPLEACPALVCPSAGPE